jgi:RNA polymerase sigma-70 factor (sigma-E family)
VEDGARELRAVAEPPAVVVTHLSPLEAVYQANYTALVALTRAILARTEGAEEIVQEAFVRTLSRWGGVDAQHDPLPYVRSAVINLCRSRMRRKLVPLAPPRSEPSAESVAVANARLDAVLAALARLPTRQREVVGLRYLAGLSTAETADALSIAEGSVKAHLHRGLAALRIDLEEERHD